VLDGTARRLSALHALTYKLTGGRVGRRLVANDMLLLTTAGRKSGRAHTVPLLYLRDGDDVLVIASWGGRDYPPHWYLNLSANPTVQVQIDTDRWSGRAVALDEPERTTWWEKAVEAYSGYATYQGRTERVIPIIRITKR
jgi:deazaflavin-dependent oxidoreductase (nitroreductase family)